MEFDNPRGLGTGGCRAFYGLGGPYALFAGKDASRALAKMSFEEKDLTGDIEGLSAYELEALTDWEYKFISKYNKVGQLCPGSKLEEVETGNKTEESMASAESNEFPFDRPTGTEPQ